MGSAIKYLVISANTRIRVKAWATLTLRGLTIFLLASSTASAIDLGFGFGSSESTGNAKCFLSGTIRPMNATSAKRGFQSLENRLRLNFDAGDPQTCERYLKSYCQNNILSRGDIPVKLTAYFRPARTIASEEDKKPTHNYLITENCKLLVE